MLTVIQTYNGSMRGGDIVVFCNPLDKLTNFLKLKFTTQNHLNNINEILSMRCNVGSKLLGNKLYKHIFTQHCKITKI